MRGAWQREPEDPPSQPLGVNLAESTASGPLIIISVPAFQVTILNPLPTKHGYTQARPKASHMLPEIPKTFHPPLSIQERRLTLQATQTNISVSPTLQVLPAPQCQDPPSLLASSVNHPPMLGARMCVKSSQDLTRPEESRLKSSSSTLRPIPQGKDWSVTKG